MIKTSMVVIYKTEDNPNHFNGAIDEPHTRICARVVITVRNHAEIHESNIVLGGVRMASGAFEALYQQKQKRCLRCGRPIENYDEFAPIDLCDFCRRFMIRRGE